MKLDINTSEYKKKLLIVLCHVNSRQLLKYFWYMYLPVLYDNFSVKCHKFIPKTSLFYFQHILAAIFVNIATVKVK